ncbi:MAG: hypothetical protein HRU14_13515, partial [Planctomycetes bacterium]|nr:hypothetical protein [Planctomycetota bacterium]
MGKGLRSIDGRCALALLYTACLLTTLEFWWLPTKVQARIGPSPLVSLEAGLGWVAACVVGFLVIPLALTFILHRERPAAIGMSLKGFHKHIWIYLALYAVMIPFILMAAEREGFQNTYPFVPGAKTNVDTFVRWEFAYLAQFVALEAFFRGYLLFTLEKRFGWNAIFVMVVPYCMIHFHKPAPECFGAII